MGGDAALITLPNGAIINKKAPELTSQTWVTEPEIVNVADGVWSIEGYSFVNFGVIEGETGLIVYDAGDDNVDGRRFLEAVREVSNKPVHTLIYSHSHYVWGGRVMLDGIEDYTVIGHPMINQNILESGGLGASVPELAPVLTGRAYEQFNIYLPEEGEDAPLAKSPIGSQDKEFVPVTRPVENEEILVVDGVKMQFFTNYHSDTDDCLMVYLPEKDVVLNNIYWPTYPNLYTLRGSVYRNPVPWLEGLRKIRDLQPEHLISTHISAVNGKEKVMEAVTNYHDGIAYVYDQTLRRILLGESPDEMRHTIQLPKHLANWPANQLTYGELSYYPPNIYNYGLGWFDGNAANINPVHPAFEAQKIVEGFGGKAKVMDAINQAMENEEYAWATQLSDYLHKVYPTNQEVRQIKADALRIMGQLTIASIPRSWYLSQARALENKVNILHAVMPSGEQILESEPGTYINMLRIRINPEKSANTDKVIVFEFTDVKDDTACGLHIRQGVAEYIDNPEKYYKEDDVTIILPRTLFAQYYIGEIPLTKLLENEEVTFMGIEAEALKILGQFDQYDAASPRLKYNIH
jgi:alkyl sulfatase BDS1-like metallo-beta-lactamase superfamily hydrolase